MYKEYKLQELGNDRFKIQELQKDGHWFTYNFSYVKGLDELISYVESWLRINTRCKYRIFDYITGKVVYE